MTDYVDPFEHIDRDEIDDKLEMAIEDPFSINFRPNEPDRIEEMPVEDQLIREVEVDLANENVQVQYNPQGIEEKYIVAVKSGEIGIVESHTVVRVEGYKSTTSINYHLVTPEQDLFYDENGYTETLNQLPRDAVEKAPGLLNQARVYDDEEFTPASELDQSRGTAGTSPVPPPEDHPMSDD